MAITRDPWRISALGTFTISGFSELRVMASGTNERDDLNLTVDEEYEHLIEDYSHLAPPSEGELLQGHVVKVGTQELIVDFGYKLEGVVPIDQVRQPDGTVAFKSGDTIDVMVD